jgi:hypothetical protein
VLLSISLSLLLDLSLLLVNLSVDLLLDLGSRFTLLDQLVLHLLRFVVDLFLELFVLGSQLLVLFGDLIDCLNVL